VQRLLGRSDVLDSLEASKAGPQYLFEDIPRRLARGPVRFRLVAQMANPGDQTSDGSIVWPDDRKVVELGTLALTAIAPDNEKLQRELTYNPDLPHLGDSALRRSDDIAPFGRVCPVRRAPALESRETATGRWS
jgi:hypothetical protein